MVTAIRGRRRAATLRAPEAGILPPAYRVGEARRKPPAWPVLGSCRPTDAEMASAHYERQDVLRDAYRALDEALYTEAEEPPEVWTLIEWGAVGFIIACIIGAAVVVMRW